MSPEILLSARGLSKCYNIYAAPLDRLKQMAWRGRRRFYTEHWALNDISFEVGRGEAIGIIGRNGAGKSTLLQIVTGTLAPTAGTIGHYGRIAALLELGAGFNPEFTGAENVRLSASLLGLNACEIEERLEAIIAFSGIGDFLHQPVKFYSSGMYARLAFSVAAHVDADILIVDEALSVGDAAFTQKCMRFFESFRYKGTILFVSHDIGAVTRLCDRVLWLDQGRLRMEGPPKAVTEAYLAAAYDDGSASFRFLPGKVAPMPAISPRPDLPNPEPPKVNVFAFNPDSAGFGLGGARVLSVSLAASDDPTRSLEGGEIVDLTIHAEALCELSHPIIGFIIKDRLGQILINRNTWASHPIEPGPIAPGEKLTARFRFALPLFDNGDYAVTAAIADGTAMTHVQHHWLHDALIFRIAHGDHGRGLVSVPMLDVALHIAP